VTVAAVLDHWPPPSLPCIPERQPSIRHALLLEAVQGIVLDRRATRISAINATLAAHGEQPTSYTELELVAATLQHPAPRC
jgi:hypothetical protein